MRSSLIGVLRIPRRGNPAKVFTDMLAIITDVVNQTTRARNDHTVLCRYGAETSPKKYVLTIKVKYVVNASAVQTRKDTMRRLEHRALGPS